MSFLELFNVLLLIISLFIFVFLVLDMYISNIDLSLLFSIFNDFKSHSDLLLLYVIVYSIFLVL